MFDVRAAKKDDGVFVECAWTRSYERYSMLASRDPLRYRRFMPTFIECLRMEDGAETRVAYDLADHDHLLGFAVLNGHELHFVYVKQQVRKLGIVPRLLEGAEIRYTTTKTDAVETRLRGSARGWEYRPRLAI